MLGRNTAESVCCVQGFIAGCTHATSLLHLFPLDPLDEVKRLWPSVDARNAIDDRTLQAPGSEQFVAGKSGSATVYLRTQLEKLHLQSSQSKVASTSSSTSVRQTLTERLWKRNFELVTGARNLGVDRDMGKARSWEFQGCQRPGPKA